MKHFHILTLFLSLCMLFTVSSSAFESPQNSTESYTVDSPSFSVDAEIMRSIDARGQQVQEAAQKKLINSRIASTDPDDLMTELSLVDIALSKADSNSPEYVDLLERQEYLELQLESLGFYELLDDEVASLFGDAVFVIGNSDSYSAQPANYEDAFYCPPDTENNRFLKSPITSTDGYYTVYITAIPKTVDSWMYHNYMGSSNLDPSWVSHPLELFWNKAEEAIIGAIDSAIEETNGKFSYGMLYDILGYAENHKIPDKFKYAYIIQDTVRARFAFVYDKSIDTYINSFISHSVYEDTMHAYMAPGSSFSGHYVNKTKTISCRNYTNPRSAAVRNFKQNNGFAKTEYVGELKLIIQKNENSNSEKCELYSHSPMHAYKISDIN